MKTILIGANGQLGTEIAKAFGDSIIPLTHKDIEISDNNQCQEIIKKIHPDLVINTAAYHNTLDCERNPEKSFAVNTMGVKNLAGICQQNRIKLVHLSTDYVFNGKKKTPYTEEDAPDPLNVYGVSKLSGEYFVKRLEDYYIIRVSSLFGVRGCRAKGGKNFVKTMLEFAATRPQVQVTSNIYSSPTYAYDAAKKLKDMIENNHPSGTYHIINSGFCSWYEFALEIFHQVGAEIKVEEKTETEELEGVKRPLYTPLTTVKTEPLRHWREALGDYLKEEKYQTKEAKID